MSRFMAGMQPKHLLYPAVACVIWECVHGSGSLCQTDTPVAAHISHSAQIRGERKTGETLKRIKPTVM